MVPEDQSFPSLPAIGYTNTPGAYHVPGSSSGASSDSSAHPLLYVISTCARVVKLSSDNDDVATRAV